MQHSAKRLKHLPQQCIIDSLQTRADVIVVNGQTSTCLHIRIVLCADQSMGKHGQPPVLPGTGCQRTACKSQAVHHLAVCGHESLHTRRGHAQPAIPAFLVTTATLDTVCACVCMRN